MVLSRLGHLTYDSMDDGLSCCRINYSWWWRSGTN